VIAARGDRGDTLIEVLIALVVIGICAVALLGALTTTLSSSGEHRSLAAVNTVEMSLADQVKSAVQLQTSAHWPSGTGSNPDCPSSGTLTQWYQNTSNVPIPSTFTSVPYNGYSVTLTNAQYWDDSSNVWTSSCPASATGVQKVTVKVSAPNNGPTDTLDVVVRKLSDGSA
jgi:prepilin-type N-terminal cleavage/methylation domain-containing protein